VDVHLDGGFRQGEARTLFAIPADGTLVGVTRDLKRFLVLESEHLANPAPLRVITAWPERVAR
jgi:hypothetical protein